MKKSFKLIIVISLTILSINLFANEINIYKKVKYQNNSKNDNKKINNLQLLANDLENSVQNMINELTELEKNIDEKQPTYNKVSISKLKDRKTFYNFHRKKYNGLIELIESKIVLTEILNKKEMELKVLNKKISKIKNLTKKVKVASIESHKFCDEGVLYKAFISNGRVINIITIKEYINPTVQTYKNIGIGSRNELLQGYIKDKDCH